MFVQHFVADGIRLQLLEKGILQRPAHAVNGDPAALGCEGEEGDRLGQPVEAEEEAIFFFLEKKLNCFLINFSSAPWRNSCLILFTFFSFGSVYIPS